MWIRYRVSLWAHLLPSWLGTEERAGKTDLLPGTFLFCGSWIPATSESGVAAGGASMSEAGCYFVKMLSNCQLSWDLMHSRLRMSLKSVSGIYPDEGEGWALALLQHLSRVLFSPLSLGSLFTVIWCLGIYSSHCRCPSVPSRPVPIAQGLRP